MSVENLDNKKKLPITPNTLFKLLREHNVSFKLFKHKPLISVNDSKSIQELIFPSNKYSVHIKNLFLRDKKKRNYLITCDQDKIINLKTLKEIIDSDRLFFGSADRLFQHLGVFPGAVSPFCMLNGIKKNVKFFCDCDLKNFKNIYLHPFVNDRSICMSINDLEKFLKRYDISINWENL